MRKSIFGLLIITLLLSACVKKPPSDVNNICHIFKQYPSWYRNAKDVEHRWMVPVSVQMAIIHQESKFDGAARPPPTKLFGFIPWTRPSSAYGYTQALRDTWADYYQNYGNLFTTRDDFGSAVDFIGWYVNQTHKRTGIPRNDAFRLYLAYHEGIGGYEHQSYRHKNWLVNVAHKVKKRADTYRAQLAMCHSK